MRSLGALLVGRLVLASLVPDDAMVGVGHGLAPWSVALQGVRLSQPKVPAARKSAAPTML